MAIVNNSQLPEGYKLTEVGVIPEDWKIYTLGETVILINGRAFKPSDWSTYGLPIIRIQNLNDPNAAYNYYGREVEERYYVNYGDVLFAWSGTKESSFGARMWRGQKAILNQHIFRVIPDKEKLSSEYVLLALKRFQEDIERKSHGFKSSFVHVKKPDLENTYLAIPPLLEQRAIATSLSDMDELLGALDRLIVKKRDLKQAAMQQLLTGKRRLPGFEGELEVKRLGELAPLQRGFDLPNSQLKQGFFPVVYSNGILNYHAVFQVKGPGVVTGRSGTIGKVTFVEENYWPHNTSLWVTSFKDNNPKFIFYLYTRLSFERFATGSGVPTLNRNDVHSFEALIPPTTEEQTAIATILSDMDAELAALEQRRDKTRALKQGMMQELLTGRTRLV